MFKRPGKRLKFHMVLVVIGGGVMALLGMSAVMAFAASY
jgi:hypothetical protein